MQKQRVSHSALLERLVRMGADAVLVNAALALALLTRYLWQVSAAPHAAILPILGQRFANAYVSNAGLVTILSLGVFYVSGFYTHGRSYRGRYKAIVVARAVSLVYLLTAALNFMLPNVISLPRSVEAQAWAWTLCFVVGGRVWSHVWRSWQKQENAQAGEPAPALAMQVPAKPRVLVIGGAGYIGSALVPQLLKAGYQVRILDLFMFGEEPLSEVRNHPGLELMRGDFRQVHRVVEAMQDVDTVVHLGAIVGDPACALDENLTIEINLMATRMIAEIAKGCQVKRFVFASTCSVYGASEEVLDENSSLNPLSLYAHSKIASEQVLKGMADAHFKPVILRFGTIFGFSGRTRFDLVVNLLAAKAVVENQITLFGGDQWRPFVHVQDAARAVCLAVEAPAHSVENQTLNVGADHQNYTLLQVGELIRGMVPTAQISDADCGNDHRNYRVSFARIRRQLNFQPEWTLERGLGQVISALNSGLVQDYRDARYSNVKFLREECLSLLNEENTSFHALQQDRFLNVEPELATVRQLAKAA